MKKETSDPNKKYFQHLHCFCTKRQWDKISAAVDSARSGPNGKTRKGDVVCTALLKWTDDFNKSRK